MDLATGLFVYSNTDITLSDVIPITLKRDYRPADTASRSFGIGSRHPYDMQLWRPDFLYEQADLILPDGGRVHYVRTSSGTGFTDAVYEHTATPTAFYKSTISWNGSGWDLRLKNGTVLVFGDTAPIRAIRDRFGNTLTIDHSGGATGNVTKITSPNHRSLSFTYDTNNRITQATDNLGRTIGYTYNTAGELWKVTDRLGGVTEYTYDTSHRMLTITDPNGTVYLTNTYDTNGRVSHQTLANSGVFAFAYTLSSGVVTQADVTDPEGHVTRTTFNSSGYSLATTEAYGISLARTTTLTRASGSNLVTAVVDALSRETDYTYDSAGNLTSMTRLAGTGDAVTSTFTYESTFTQIASITDPLSHTTTFGYDGTGHMTSVTDPMSHQMTFTYNSAGQPVTATDALGDTTTFTYDRGSLATVTSPLSESSTIFSDGAGRMVRRTDPTGHSTRFEYDSADRLTKLTDALEHDMTFTYDANGNMLTMTDQRGKTTAWTYDSMNRLSTSTDALSRTASLVYNLDGCVTSITDRKTQVTDFTYDALHRRLFAGFGRTGTPPSYESTLDATYDAGSRMTQAVDSIAGTITRTFDGLDRLAQEVTTEGTVDYTYDDAGRRSTMQVAGQSAVSYSYDDRNRLTGISQGTSSVLFVYDAANRRTSLTLPNGMVVEYGYDNASRVNAITYKMSGATLGALTYGYNAAGRRTTVGGSYSRSALPSVVTSATYDDANQIATFNGTSFTYDANGSLSSDGSLSYTWNARNQLTAITGGTTAAFEYDATGRRRTKTLGGSTTQFLYDGLNAVQELTAGSPTANILTGLDIDEVLTRTESSVIMHYLADALGSSVALADGSGTVQTQYTYEPFGSVAATGATTTSTATFTGREHDGGSLHYFRARYYDSRLGRFISEDPAGLIDGPNGHLYVGDGPTNATDPLGLWTKEVCDKVRKILDLEDRYGTWFAAKTASITYGSGPVSERLLYPFDSGSNSPIQNVNTPVGPVQVDWFADITYAVGPFGAGGNPGVLGVYAGGKLGWTGLRWLFGADIGHFAPFADAGETNAALAVWFGYGFKDIFTPTIMAKECCGK